MSTETTETTERYPIETAPLDGTLIFVMNDKYPGKHLMEWNKRNKRWEGRTYAVMGMRVTYWAPEFDQPTHWAPV